MGGTSGGYGSGDRAGNSGGGGAVVDVAAADNGNGKGAAEAAAAGQGLTLVHFSAQLERFVWDRGCA
jgi:hypothetical protein